MRATVLLSICALLTAGCVSSARPGYVCGGVVAPSEEAPAAAGTDTLAARAGGAGVTLLRLDDQGLFGSDVTLARFDERESTVLHGRVGPEVVTLRARSTQVTGLIDTAPVDLRLTRGDDWVVAVGLVKGRPSRLRVDATQLVGRLAYCSYDLQRVPGGFAGRRFCPSGADNFTLDLPDRMARWTDAEVISVIVALLSRS